MMKNQEINWVVMTLKMNKRQSFLVQDALMYFINIKTRKSLKKLKLIKRSRKEFKKKGLII